jgi:two-component system, cell cycle sensor histidine kinase PleC
MASPESPIVVADLDADGPTAGDIAANVSAFLPEITCGEVFSWLRANPFQPAVPVVDENGNVLGLVNRLMFLARYAAQYAPELYSKKPILKLASTDPLVVDEHISITDLGETVLADHPNALMECFIVTSRGRYLGLGTAEALVRSKMQLLLSRGARLSEALECANEANRAKGSFLALMSHELRTPLNAILGFSEIISTEAFGTCGPRYRDYAGDIHGAGKHLLALINDILDLSKAEAGKLELRCEPVDFADIINECVRLMRAKAAEQGLRITIAAAPLPPMLVDRLRVKQMLLNLLSNAVKFTPDGGAIWVEACHDANHVIICVRDTGIGIAPDMIPVALEPFRQIESALSRKFEGTGLGLSLVKSLIESHGGQVTIESILEKGTSVSLLFSASRCVADPVARTA